MRCSSVEWIARTECLEMTSSWCRAGELRKLWDSLSELRSCLCERRLERTVPRPALKPSSNLLKYLVLLCKNNNNNNNNNNNRTFYFFFSFCFHSVLWFSCSGLHFIELALLTNAQLSQVYWTVHHFDSWIKTDQLDVIRFIYFTIYCSTCFEC